MRQASWKLVPLALVFAQPMGCGSNSVDSGRPAAGGPSGGNATAGSGGATQPGGGAGGSAGAVERGGAGPGGGANGNGGANGGGATAGGASRGGENSVSGGSRNGGGSASSTGGNSNNGGSSQGGARSGGAGATSNAGGKPGSGGASTSSGGATLAECYGPSSADARLPLRLPASLPMVTAGKAAIADLHRGVNLGNALEAPDEGEWGVTLSSAHFQVFADAGFDHVRLPVRFSAHAATSAPYTIDASFFSRVDWALEQAQSRGLAVVLDVHHFMELLSEPASSKARFIALWEQIATRYRSRPASLKFELMNEPNGALDAQWNAIFPEALAAVRAIDPTRTVILDGTSWAAATTLELLPAITDPAVVVTFHMYEPILFTHQAASWMTAEYQTRGVAFPAPPCSPVNPTSGTQAVAWTAEWFMKYNQAPAATNPGGMKAVEDVFAAVDAFIARTGRAAYLGEFGVIDKADVGSRARWVRLIRESAEARGVPWAYWDDGGSFKIVTPATNTWNASLKAALLGP